VLERILSSFAIVSKSNQSGLMKPAEKSLAEHVGLRDAIVLGNAALAERLMYAHLLEARAAAARLAETAPRTATVY
jgi:DNA-binding GntR family transcriptional regulator